MLKKGPKNRQFIDNIIQSLGHTYIQPGFPMKALDEPDVVNLLKISVFYFQESYTELLWKKERNDDVSWELTII